MTFWLHKSGRSQKQTDMAALSGNQMLEMLDEPWVEGETIHLGVAGLGLAGALMVRAASQLPGVSLVAAADFHQAPLQAFARDFQARVYQDIRDLCADPMINVVYIGTPHQFHAEHAVIAAEHGKHVILEKPMAMTLEECDAILSAVRRYNVHFVQGHTHAYDPAIRAMRRIVESGRLGRVRMITTLNYTDFLYRPRRPDELDTAQGGGIVFNQIPHQIDIVRTLGGGRLRSVRASCAVLDESRPTETSAAAFWEFEDGVFATTIYSGADFFSSDEFHGWIGESGLPRKPDHSGARSLLKQSGKLDEAQLRSKRLSYGAPGLNRHDVQIVSPPHFGTTIVTCERGEMKTSPHGITLYDETGAHELFLPKSTGYEGLFNDLRYALRTGFAPLHCAQWGKAGVEAMLALLQSAHERREVSLAFQSKL